MNPRLQAVLAPAGLVAVSCLVVFGLRAFIGDPSWFAGLINHPDVGQFISVTSPGFPEWLAALGEGGDGLAWVAAAPQFALSPAGEVFRNLDYWISTPKFFYLIPSLCIGVLLVYYVWRIKAGDEMYIRRPHAPAHGHRHKHHDTSGTKVTLQFDTDLGVYVVLGHRDHYWSGDRYFRWSGEHWEVSTALAGGWTVVVRGSLPHRLAAKHADHKARHKSKAHHKKRKQIPAKHRH